LQSDTIANLLAINPSMQIQINQVATQCPCPIDEVRNTDRNQQFAATYTSYLNLPKLLLRLEPNASRISTAAQFSLPKSGIRKEVNVSWLADSAENPNSLQGDGGGVYSDYLIEIAKR